MKRALPFLLVTCALVAVADEPQPAAAPHAAVPPAAAQPGQDYRLDTQKLSELIRRMIAEGRDAQSIAGLVLRDPSDTCYFIRTIRPVQPAPTATGLIKIQARIGAIEHGPDCTNGGALRPSTPVLGPDTGDAASDPVLTPVANR